MRGGAIRPAFSFGPSASDSQSIGRPGPRFVTTRAAEEAAVVLYCDPPDTGLEVESRLAVAKHDALDFLSPRLHRAVESDPQAYDRIVATPGRVGRVSAELRAQRSRTAPRTVACLTSSPRDRDAAHEVVVRARIRGCASVGTRHSSGISVERVTLALERPIQ
jgi:hypothetical protein